MKKIWEYMSGTCHEGGWLSSWYLRYFREDRCWCCYLTRLILIAFLVGVAFGSLIVSIT